MQYILALDQGTTNSKSILVDKHGDIVYSQKQGIKNIFPHSGWVEQNANEIWQSQLSTAQLTIANAKVPVENIMSIGIANQRETTINME